jgi:hypothetical protein
MNERKMSQTATDWLDAARRNPEDFVDTYEMMHLMHRDGVTIEEREHILMVVDKIYKGQ